MSSTASPAGPEPAPGSAPLQPHELAVGQRVLWELSTFEGRNTVRYQLGVISEIREEPGGPVPVFRSYRYPGFHPVRVGALYAAPPLP